MLGMTRWRRRAGGAVAALAVVVVGVVVHRHKRTEAGLNTMAIDRQVRRPSSEDSEPRATVGRERSPEVAAPRGKQRAAVVSKARANELRAAIRALADATRSSPTASPRPVSNPGASEASQSATLDRQYIRQAIDDITPLIQGCFDLARGQQPSLRADQVTVHFTIEGDQDLGGVVAGSTVDALSEGTPPLLTTCVTETMYALQLPAPTGRGKVEVTYPFRAAPVAGPERR